MFNIFFVLGIAYYIDLCIADAAGIGVVVSPPNKLVELNKKRLGK